MANSLDKIRKKMNILAFNEETNDDNKSIIRSKNIICPLCGEDVKIKINNYKIDLFDCKNGHSISHIPLNEFDSTQLINLENIKCDVCKENNKYTAYNNDFYKCYECNKNICPLCKLKHDKENKAHSIYNYDNNSYICAKHNEIYIHFCEFCQTNICTLCEKEHLNHSLLLLSKIMPDKKDILINLDNLKNSINNFNVIINKITGILYTVKININNYYKFVENIINNFDLKKRNYQILKNLNEIINNNNNIIKELNPINNRNDINDKISNIVNIYIKLNHNINMHIHPQMYRDIMLQNIASEQQQQQFLEWLEEQEVFQAESHIIPVKFVKYEEIIKFNGKKLLILFCHPNDKISNLLEKYNNFAFNVEPQTKFIYNGEILSPNLTINEAGITDESYIYVATPLTIFFRRSEPNPVVINCYSNDSVLSVIEKYRIISNDRDTSKKFIYNAKRLQFDKNMAEAGITNNSNIFVVKGK